MATLDGVMHGMPGLLPLAISRRGAVRLGAGGIAAGMAPRGHGASAAADATPAAGSATKRMRLKVLAEGDVPAFPALPATISLFQSRFDPGAFIEIPADDPALSLVYVESGIFTVTVTSRAGDSLVGPANSGGMIRNDASEVATMLFATITPMAGDLPAL
jgi:hypothetical protein